MQVLADFTNSFFHLPEPTHFDFSQLKVSANDDDEEIETTILTENTNCAIVD